MKQILPFLLIILIFSPAYSQLNMEVVGSDLRGPIGITLDAGSNLWIAESGTGANDGAVSVIWSDGTQQRVIDNLPSLYDTLSAETAGPTRVQVFNEQYLGVLLAGGLPDVGSSIVVFEIDSITPGGTVLGLENAANIIHLEERVLQLGFAESNGFSFVHDGSDLYIADAAANAIMHRDGLTGVIKPIASFPPSPNPLPFGPPVYEAVPTRILHNPDGGFYVSQLTGFPFLDGASKIFGVDSAGQVSVIDSGLTLVTDMALAPSGDGLLALQFANFRGDSLPPFLIGSAQITKVGFDGSKDTIATGFGPSPGLAVAGENDFYVTNLLFGTVTHLTASTTANKDFNELKVQPLTIAPNPVTENFSVSWQQPESGPAILRISSFEGKTLMVKNLGQAQRGDQNLELNRNSLNLSGISNQPLVIMITSGKNIFANKIILAK